MEKKDNLKFTDGEKTIGYNGPEIAKNFSKEQFIAHEKHNFAGDNDAAKKLGEVYDAIINKYGEQKDQSKPLAALPLAKEETK